MTPQKTSPDFVQLASDFASTLSLATELPPLRKGTIANWADLMCISAAKVVELNKASDLNSWPVNAQKAVQSTASLIDTNFELVELSIAAMFESADNFTPVTSGELNLRQWLDAILSAGGSTRVGEFSAQVQAEIHMEEVIRHIDDLMPLLRLEGLPLQAREAFYKMVADRLGAATYAVSQKRLKISDGQHMLNKVALWLKGLATPRDGLS